VQFKTMLYNMVWVGLKANLVSYLRPLTKDNGKFIFSEKHFDRTADVDSQPQNYDSQQQMPPGK